MTALARQVSVYIEYADGSCVQADLTPREGEGGMIVDILEIERTEEVALSADDARSLGKRVHPLFAWGVERRLSVKSAGTMALRYKPPLDEDEPDEEVSPL